MSFWDRIAGFYDISQSINGKVYSEMLDITQRLVPEGAKVLDTAAGTGALSFAAAKKAAEVVCTDLSLPMLDRARKKAVAKGVDNIRFEARNIFDLADEDETYDIVMAGNVLHLLSAPQKAVRELCRVTKKGGLILLPTFMTKRQPVTLKLYKVIGYSSESDYSPKEYVQMLRESGCGRVKAKLIKGMIPCCYAIIKKTN
ncbi:MAG: class I SAM-dependent methyltransferase [Ruminococcaceae bacterium]|nr:class I SAM-dependent methyltransferase [Oscillospiraceae bacterium]